MSNLQRMIIIPPEIFEKIKKIVLDDSKLSELDKNMKSILRNNKLTDLNKWHLYRQNLLAYSSMKRKNAHKNKFNWYQPPIRHVQGVEVQTKRIFTKDKETNTDSSPQVFDKYTQADIPKVQEEYIHTDEQANQAFPAEEILGDNDDVFDDDDSIVTDDVINPNEILRERASSDPNSYRSFEMKDGATISVPTKGYVFKKTRGILRPPKPGSQQTTLNLAARKSNRPLTVQTIKRSEQERLQNPSWTTIK